MTLFLALKCQVNFLCAHVLCIVKTWPVKNHFRDCKVASFNMISYGLRFYDTLHTYMLTNELCRQPLNHLYATYVAIALLVLGCAMIALLSLPSIRGRTSTFKSIAHYSDTVALLSSTAGSRHCAYEWLYQNVLYQIRN